MARNCLTVNLIWHYNYSCHLVYSLYLEQSTSEWYLLRDLFVNQVYSLEGLQYYWYMNQQLSSDNIHTGMHWLTFSSGGRSMPSLKSVALQSCNHLHAPEDTVGLVWSGLIRLALSAGFPQSNNASHIGLLSVCSLCNNTLLPSFSTSLWKTAWKWSGF